MRIAGRHFKIAQGLTCLLLACACSNGKTGSQPGVISIVIPAVSKHAAALSTPTYNYANACFAINVKAADIPSQPGTGACLIPIGVFSGFVAPGGVLSLQVPVGSSRSLEVYSYVREKSSLPCPTQLNLGSISPAKIVRVASVASFDVAAGVETNLNVQLSAPAATDNLISQLSLPPSCRDSAPPPLSSAALTLGHGDVSGGGYVVHGTLSGQTNAKLLSGGNYLIRLSRRPN